MPLNLESLLLSEFFSKGIIPTNDILPFANYSKKVIESQLKKMWQKKQLEMFEGYFFHNEYFDIILKTYSEKLKNHLEMNSHLKGLTPEQIADIVKLDTEKNNLIIKYLVAQGRMVKIKDLYNLSGRNMSLKGAVKKAYVEIMKSLEENRYTPPTLNKLSLGGKQYKDAIKFIIDSNQGYKCGSEFIFIKEVWEEIIKFIKKQLEDNNRITVSELRDGFDFSRKYCIPIFEETDRIKFTKRDGDIRIKGANFENEEFNL